MRRNRRVASTALELIHAPHSDFALLSVAVRVACTLSGGVGVRSVFDSLPSQSFLSKTQEKPWSRILSVA